ncbi:MAG: hypothetical protein HY859_15340 [Caulobacterales bacterium]|nr:hypothetical protein [Caulobacterales bacterium]
MTIRTRLIASIAAIQTLFLITMVIATLTIGREAASRRIEVQAGQKADLAAILLRKAVWGSDVAAARELAQELVDGDALVSAVVFDRRGAVLASASDAGPAPRRAARASRPIQVDGVAAGTVAVEVSGDFLDGVLAGIYSKLVLIAACLVLLSAGASWMFGNLMTRRLAALRLSAEALAQGDFELRMSGRDRSRWSPWPRR